jgi:hypothetical protein
VKAFALFAVILASTFSSFGGPPTWQELNSHLYTNGPIVWQAPTNNLPTSLWIYKRLPPRPFLATVISNAAVLASLQNKELPKPSTNAFFINSTPDPCGMGFSIFSIQPASTTISFSSTNQILSTGNVLDDDTVTRLAFEYAARFGLNRTYLIPKNVYTGSNGAGCDGTLTNGICTRGILLSRKLDGVAFFSADNEADSVEGFSIEFGGGGQIRSFSLVWPNLERCQSASSASPQQIINYIRAHKAIVLPAPDEEDYFARLKTLATAKKLTITKITPYYGEGIIGEVPTNDLPPEFVTPFAELEAVADFGNSNAVVQLVSPILSSEVNRLLAK